MVSKSGQVHGWPIGGFPAPQGPFYCGVGSESVYGRQLAEAHMDACIRVSMSTLSHPASPAAWLGCTSWKCIIILKLAKRPASLAASSACVSNAEAG